MYWFELTALLLLVVFNVFLMRKNHLRSKALFRREMRVADIEFGVAMLALQGVDIHTLVREHLMHRRRDVDDVQYQ